MTPWTVRVVILFMYGSIVWQGAHLLRLYLMDGIMAILPTDSIHLGLQTILVVHGLEIFIAYAFGKVSMEGIRVRFLYEHHFPVFIIAFAAKIHYSSDTEASSDPFIQLILPIMSMCMVFQVNEFSFVARTFASKFYQVSLWLKLMQHSIGMVTMPVVSIVFTGMGLYCIWHRALMINGSICRWLVCISMIFLGVFIQPRYVKGHFQAIKRTNKKINELG